MLPAAGLEPASLVIPLRPGRGQIELHETGFRHPRSTRFGGRVFTSYPDLTHLQLGARMLRVATRQGVFWLRRRDFADPRAPENLVRALLERIVRKGGGASQLGGMAEVEEAARSARPPRLTIALVLVCLAVHFLQLAGGPLLAHAGHFSAALASHGESWRLVTGNLLHGLPGDGTLGWVHLGLNLLGLLGVGALVELPLGAPRTAFVVGLSGLGAMGAGWVAGYDYAVGASGIVAGLAGAAAWLEFRRGSRLPAGWRVPRRFFVGVLLANGMAPLLLPVLAGEAHLGGFIAGGLGAALCTDPGLRRDAPPALVVAADAVLGLLVAGSLVAAAPLAAGRPAALDRHARRVLALPAAPPMLLNNTAWLIATAPEASPGALERARRLAARAVAATAGEDPGMLDTLAEALFRSGDAPAARAIIEEAIALAPDEPYYREQRRRFTGERAAEDRPPPPDAPAPPATPGAPPRLPPDDAGLTV